MSQSDDLVVFALVAEAGSFSQVAGNLNIAKSAVSKQISRLEKQLGARLFNRTTRRLSLTEAGLRVLPHAQRIQEELGGINDAVLGLQSKATGTLRVSAPVALGNRYLAALAPRFLEAYPEVELVLSLNDRRVDMVAEGFDLSIRLTQSPPDNWQARKLKQISYHICATPAYWDAHGRPSHPSQLANHSCLLSQESNSVPWRFSHAVEGEIEQSISSGLIINTSEGLRAATIENAGVALLPDYAIEDDCQQGRLETVLSDYQVEGPYGDTLYALYLPNRYLPPKARVFIDFLAQELSSSQ